MAVARSAGIAMEKIVLDPGYGFGKRFEENYALLARQAELLEPGKAAAGRSKQESFLRHTLEGIYAREVPMEARDRASITAMTAAF